ncbi:MAG: DUF1080 domain-containing protein [Pirellulales bacterium]|nr:DUF1080 domain-containing protein [Pirellulales bacterium]
MRNLCLFYRSLKQLLRCSALWMAWCGLLTGLPAFAGSVEYLPGVEWPEPLTVAPGAQNTQPPSDAIVLFGGTDLSAWENGEKWKVENGVAIVQEGYIHTKQSFGDCQLHVEWSAPAPPLGNGQQRSNSGVFMMGMYEIQILDSYQNKTYFEGQAGAVYKQAPPLVNATRPPGEWNVYDILWTAPRFKDDGSLQSPAYVTLLHNGVLVQNHFPVLGATNWTEPPAYTAHAEKLPIALQDHLNPVRYRNIWVREIKPMVGTQVRKPSFIDHRTGKKWPVDAKQAVRVSGLIAFNGQPLPLGRIAFVDEKLDLDYASRIVGGKYQLRGQIKPGEYTVTVSGPAALPAKYSEIETTTLRAQLESGDNAVDYDLTH